MSSFLIVRLGSLGDVVHAIPVAAALRSHFPSARIDWIVDPHYTALLDLVTVLDRRIPIDPRALLKGGERRRLLQVIRELRNARYDAVLDLQGLLKSAVLARLAGGARTIGFSRRHLREPLAGLLYTSTHDPGAAAHVVDKNLALLAAVGVHDCRPRFPLDVPRSAVVDALRVRFPQGYVLINPGAAWPNKRWPAARFGSAAARIREEYGLNSLVLWGPAERPLAQAVVDSSAGAAELSPPTSIPELAAVAQGAHLMISGDTGPLHVAAAVGTPLVGLFGPTRAERNGPFALYDISISRVDRCDCVYERRCRRNVPCIDDISVDEVLGAVKRRMAAPRA